MKTASVIRTFVSLVVFLFGISSLAFSASPDGQGPWADTIVTSNQANTKSGTPVSVVNPARSDPNAALGVAENDTQDNHFFSLGFGGSITLGFENGVQTGLIVVEATNPDYPIEQALVEVSSDGVSFVSAGVATQDDKFRLPRGIECVNFVRITDMSNPQDFSDDTADGFDLDGVQAKDGTPCQLTPSTTPTPVISLTPTPTLSAPVSPTIAIGGPVCNSTKPSTPTIISVTRTSPSIATINWIAVSPATHYSVYYGTQPGNYVYSVVNTGNTNTFAVGGLDANLIYYFQVRAVNDCTPGDPSVEVSVGTIPSSSGSTNGQVLGATTLADTGNTAAFIRALKSLAVSLSVFLVLHSLQLHGQKKIA